MWSKLVKGELSLAATFWKFGIVGLVIIRFAVKIFGFLLGGYLKGASIADYFLHNFHPIFSSKLSILWTLCYISSLLILIAYSWNIIVAVWRSSAAYDKSVWLSLLARIFIIAAVALVWLSLDFRPFF